MQWNPTGRKPLTLVLILLVGFAVMTEPAMACEGEEQEAALELIYRSLMTGYNAMISGRPWEALTRLNELSQEQQNMSESCQIFIQDVVGALSGIFSPKNSTPSCYGVTCCDGSGCYIN